MKVTSIPFLKTVIKDTNDKLATACKYFSLFLFYICVIYEWFKRLKMRWENERKRVKRHRTKKSFENRSGN